MRKPRESFRDKIKLLTFFLVGIAVLFPITAITVPQHLTPMLMFFAIAIWTSLTTLTMLMVMRRTTARAAQQATDH